MLCHKQGSHTADSTTAETDVSESKEVSCRDCLLQTILGVVAMEVLQVIYMIHLV